MNGRTFQSASETVNPNPSRIDFWITTSACDWNAFTSMAPTLLRLLRMWMSGSPSAYAIVELKNSQPSGSSVAIEPTSASCTSGMSSVTFRYASITPIGSFQGSKRDTWHMSGRSTSMPNWSQTKAASSGESAMFFGDSGSIAGGTMWAPSKPGLACATSPLSSCGTYCSTCQTEASYSLMNGTIRAMASGFGVERSMWHRQIQVLPLFGTCRLIAAGCGSWTMITSHSPEISVAFSA